MLKGETSVLRSLQQMQAPPNAGCLSSYITLPLLYLTPGQLNTLVALFQFWRQHALQHFMAHHSQLQPKGCMVLHTGQLRAIQSVVDTAGMLLSETGPVSISDVSKVSLSDLGLEEVGRLCVTYDQEVALGRAQPVTWEQVHRAYLLRVRLHTAMSDIQQTAHTQSDSAALQALAQTTLSYVLQPPSQEETHYMEHVYRTVLSAAQTPRAFFPVPAGGRAIFHEPAATARPTGHLHTARPADLASTDSPWSSDAPHQTFCQAASTGDPAAVTPPPVQPAVQPMAVVQYTAAQEPVAVQLATSQPAGALPTLAASEEGSHRHYRKEGVICSPEKSHSRSHSRSRSHSHSHSRRLSHSRSPTHSRSHSPRGCSPRRGRKGRLARRRSSSHGASSCSDGSTRRHRGRRRSRSPKSRRHHAAHATTSHRDRLEGRDPGRADMRPPGRDPRRRDNSLRALTREFELRLGAALARAGAGGMTIRQLKGQYQCLIPYQLKGSDNAWNYLKQLRGLVDVHWGNIKGRAASVAPVQGLSAATKETEGMFRTARLMELKLCWYLSEHGPLELDTLQKDFYWTQDLSAVAADLKAFVRQRPVLFSVSAGDVAVVRSGWRLVLELPPV